MIYSSISSRKLIDIELNLRFEESFHGKNRKAKEHLTKNEKIIHFPLSKLLLDSGFKYFLRNETRTDYNSSPFLGITAETV